MNINALICINRAKNKRIKMRLDGVLFVQLAGLPDPQATPPLPACLVRKTSAQFFELGGSNRRLISPNLARLAPDFTSHIALQANLSAIQAFSYSRRVIGRERIINAHRR